MNNRERERVRALIATAVAVSLGHESEEDRAEAWLDGLTMPDALLLVCETSRRTGTLPGRIVTPPPMETGKN